MAENGCLRFWNNVEIRRRILNIATLIIGVPLILYNGLWFFAFFIPLWTFVWSCPLACVFLCIAVGVTIASIATTASDPLYNKKLFRFHFVATVLAMLAAGVTAIPFSYYMAATNYVSHFFFWGSESALASSLSFTIVLMLLSLLQTLDHFAEWRLEDPKPAPRWIFSCGRRQEEAGPNAESSQEGSTGPTDRWNCCSYAGTQRGFLNIITMLSCSVLAVVSSVGAKLVYKGDHSFRIWAVFSWIAAVGYFILFFTIGLFLFLARQRNISAKLNKIMFALHFTLILLALSAALASTVTLPMFIEPSLRLALLHRFRYTHLPVIAVFCCMVIVVVEFLNSLDFFAEWRRLQPRPAPHSLFGFTQQSSAQAFHRLEERQA